jgi:hypothetical protein
MAIFMAIFLWLFLLTAVLSGFFSLLSLFLAFSLYCRSFWLFFFTAVLSSFFSLLPLFLGFFLYCCSFWLFLFTAVLSGFFSLLPLFLAVSLHGCYFAAVSLSSFFRSCFSQQLFHDFLPVISIFLQAFRHTIGALRDSRVRNLHRRFRHFPIKAVSGCIPYAHTKERGEGHGYPVSPRMEAYPEHGGFADTSPTAALHNGERSSCY